MATVKLYGNVSALTLAGVEIVRGEDGSLEVPVEHAAELCQAFSLRDTPEEAKPAREPVPAEDHEIALAELAEAKASRDATLEANKALEQRAADLEARLAAATAAAPKAKGK